MKHSSTLPSPVWRRNCTGQRWQGPATAGHPLPLRHPGIVKRWDLRVFGKIPTPADTKNENRRNSALTTSHHEKVRSSVDCIKKNIKRLQKGGTILPGLVSTSSHLSFVPFAYSLPPRGSHQMVTRVFEAPSSSSPPPPAPSHLLSSRSFSSISISFFCHVPFFSPPHFPRCFFILMTADTLVTGPPNAPKMHPKGKMVVNGGHSGHSFQQLRLWDASVDVCSTCPTSREK